MERQPTIKDIAQALGMSTSTVSRAMRDAADVKPETRKAVKAYAEKIDYQPNRLALSFLKKQTNTVGVIVPNLDHVLAKMVMGIDEVMLEAGYTVIVCQSDESFGREIVNTKRLLESLVDGLIVSVSSETKVFDHIKKIQSRKIPLVLFDRIPDEMKAPKVRLDNVGGGYLAGQHLAQQGFKHVAIIGGPENLTITKERMQGCIEGLGENGLDESHCIKVFCNFDQAHAYEAMKELLERPDRPDAIFAVSDRLAIGAMQAIKEKGLSMPGDIGLVGFNNEPVVSLVTPQITSIEMNAFEIGKATGKMFLEMLHSDVDKTNEVAIIKPKLFVRESSKRIDLPQ